jgi:hypothetical protein
MVRGLDSTLLFEFFARAGRAKLSRNFLKRHNGIKCIKLNYIQV